MLVTQRWLDKIGACPEARRAIDQAFPDGMELTEENVLALYEEGVDVFYAVDELLDEKGAAKILLLTMQRMQRRAVKALLAAGFLEEAARIKALCFRARSSTRDALPTLREVRLELSVAYDENEYDSRKRCLCIAAYAAINRSCDMAECLIHRYAAGRGRELAGSAQNALEFWEDREAAIRAAMKAILAAHPADEVL